MIHEKLKKAAIDSKPYAEKLLGDTIKGYVFGCVFSVFTPSREPVYRTMHESGKNFAKMSAVYSITEMSLQKVRKSNSSYNNFAAGALAGALGSKKGIIPGATVFSLYSGLSAYFSSDK